MRKVSVIGLGYVGLPVAVAFGNSQNVIGFDVNANRIKELTKGFDRNLEVSEKELNDCSISFTDSVEELKSADFHIVTVPTPITKNNVPDLSIVYKASETVGKALKKGDIVVYESTVYPGVTEEECIPILEKVSNLTYGKDFTVGYSPERINPGDKNHTFTKIKKVVSGSDNNTLDIIADTYCSVVTAGVFKAASIKVAEAAKVIENTQRDINIAFMNELSLIFEKMDINTSDVLEAAGTKWNFLKFYPGLVGGHCIGVDPYYLTHKAASLGYEPEVILSGRKINDGMGKHVAQKLVKEMIKNGHDVSKSTVTFLGLTFKENTPDIRNSKIVDIIRELESYGITIQVNDPLAMKDDAINEYNIELKDLDQLNKANAVILGVSHKQYEELNSDYIIDKLLVESNPVVFGIRSHIEKTDFLNKNINCWYL